HLESLAAVTDNVATAEPPPVKHHHDDALPRAERADLAAPDFEPLEPEPHEGAPGGAWDVLPSEPAREPPRASRIVPKAPPSSPQRAPASVTAADELTPEAPRRAPAKIERAAGVWVGGAGLALGALSTILVLGGLAPTAAGLLAA